MPKNGSRELSDTQQKILNEAFILFGRHGYDGMSMKVLAQNTGITKAALYWHYESKDDLYLECVRKITNLVQDHTHSPLTRTDISPPARLTTLVAGIRALLTHPDLVGGVAGYWLTPSDHHLQGVWEVVRGFRKRSFRLLEDNLAEGQKQGLFEFDIPLEQLARTVHYSIESNIIPLSFFANTLEVRNHVALVMDTFMRAYSPQHKGLGLSLEDLDRLLDKAWARQIELLPHDTYVRPAPDKPDESAETLM